MKMPGLSLNLAGLSSLGKDNRPSPGEVYDLLILGGGPACMSAAIYAARKLLKVAILAKDFGGQVASTSEVENYLGFQSIDGKELANRFIEQLQKFQVPPAKGE